VVETLEQCAFCGSSEARRFTRQAKATALIKSEIQPTVTRSYYTSRSYEQYASICTSCINNRRKKRSRFGFVLALFTITVGLLAYFFIVQPEGTWYVIAGILVLLFTLIGSLVNLVSSLSNRFDRREEDIIIGELSDEMLNDLMGKRHSQKRCEVCGSSDVIRKILEAGEHSNIFKTVSGYRCSPHDLTEVPSGFKVRSFSPAKKK
jgi:hypothetical protein